MKPRQDSIGTSGRQARKLEKQRKQKKHIYQLVVAVMKR